MRFRHTRGGVKSPINLQLNKENINYKSEVKFLGVWLNETLKWDHHVQYLTKKLGKVCFAIRIIKNVADLNTVKTLYFSSYQSLLTYGIIFWGNSTKSKEIFILQKKVVRIIVGAKLFEPCRKRFRKFGIPLFLCLYFLSFNVAENESNGK